MTQSVTDGAAGWPMGVGSGAEYFGVFSHHCRPAPQHPLCRKTNDQLSKTGVADRTTTSRPCCDWCTNCRSPDTMHRADTDTALPGHCGGHPVRVLARRIDQCAGDNALLDPPCRNHLPSATRCALATHASEVRSDLPRSRELLIVFVEVEAAFSRRQFSHKSHRPHPRGDSTVMRQVPNRSLHIPELRQIARYLGTYTKATPLPERPAGSARARHSEHSDSPGFSGV